MIIQVYLDPETERRLKMAAVATGRKIEDLAECAVAEAALADAKERHTGKGPL